MRSGSRPGDWARHRWSVAILGKDGRLLGESDDGKGRPRRRGGGGGRDPGPVSTDPAFDLTMPAGQDEVKIVVKDLMDRGGVRLPLPTPHRARPRSIVPAHDQEDERGQPSRRGGTAP